MTHENARTTALTRATLIEAAKVIPEGTPFYMLNLLRYKERAEYPEGTALGPCSGREAYHRGYVGTFMKLTADLHEADGRDARRRRLVRLGDDLFGGAPR